MPFVMNVDAWKIGQLARRTGLTVRTLHHYDQIRLLRPSARSASGHRIYSPSDLARLQQIVSLRQVGFSLTQIKRCLRDPDFVAADALRLQLEHVKQQIQEQQKLCARLETLASAMRSRKKISNEDLIQIIQDTVMYEKYFTPEQSEKIKQRAQQVGQERIEQSQRDWQNLMSEVQAEMDKGTLPTDPRVVALAKLWYALVEEFTAGDPGIRDSLKKMYQTESVIHGMQIDPMREMMKYIAKAREVGGRQ
jgi:DNA-binding transcriptional MerR regulator